MRTLFLLIFFVFGLSIFGQKIELVPADPVFLPGAADSNSPLHWSKGKLFVYNSNGQPVRSEGASMQTLRYARAINFRNPGTSPWWIEATYRAPDGRVYAWYHHEVYGVCGDDN